MEPQPIPALKDNSKPAKSATDGTPGKINVEQ
jgi:hypothetical protein